MFISKYFLTGCLVLLALLLHTDAKVFINLGQQTEYFEGDIQLPKNRNGILAMQRWPNGIIPYEPLANTWGQYYQDILRKAMKEIEDHSCVRFRPRTDEANYIVFYAGRGCSSPVGMTGKGAQYISLTDSATYGSCWSHSTVVHELLHAVGLWHEQSRYDRDEYLIIRWENIANSSKHNFDMKFSNETSFYDLPYDYLSIMHYDKKSASMNGEITMETIDPSMQDWIGNAVAGSDIDYEKVRRIYECKGSFPTMPPIPTTPSPPCEDKITYCNEQLKACGEWWTTVSCRRTCGFCTDGCKDEIDYCHQYARQCKKLDWLKTYCKKTCGLCSPS